MFLCSFVVFFNIRKKNLFQECYRVIFDVQNAIKLANNFFWKKIVEYGFANLDIVRIHTGIFEFNTASQRVLEKCGFKKEAVFEKAIFKKNRLWGEVRYALLKPE
ncbi:MAG: N-acetyltransferase [Bacteroidia bacterium]|nr:N-acetyltransferase [Bacteroidia bacterium]